MLSSNEIKVVLFDLDGTLRHSQPDGGEFFIDHAISLGLPISDDDRLRGIRWEHYYWASSPQLRADLGLYQDFNPVFWKNYNRRQLVALGISQRQADELTPAISQFMEEHYRHVSVLTLEVPGILTWLLDNGYRLGVVSNRDVPFDDELQRLGIQSYFGFSLAAGEVNSYKPQPGIFEAALKRMDARAQETMYVGDNYFADVVGARCAGLKPVLFDPRGIYPDAPCLSIKSFNQLPDILKAG